MILRIWFSRASETHPWRVQIDSDACGLYSTDELNKLLCGETAIKTRFNPLGFDLPDGPKAIIEVEVKR